MTAELTAAPQVDAERATLGALLTGTVSLDDVPYLGPNLFADPRHAHIFNAIRACHLGGKPVNAVTVDGQLRSVKLSQKTGSGVYLVELLESCPVADALPYYAEQVRQDAQRREVEALGVRLQQIARGGQDLDDVLAGAQEQLARTVALTGTTDKASGPLEILSMAEIAKAVDNAPPRRWLFQGVWGHGSYGILAAQYKAGKTWATLDAAVSVATGTPWLGHYAVHTPGRVVMFVGEGGKSKMIRRLRAVARHKGFDSDDLPIDICFRVPHLAETEHMRIITQYVESAQPVLIIIDPLYLAAKGADSRDLMAMGAVLEPLQLLAEDAGASLIIAHHWNKTGEGKGHNRATGTGSAEWGRVLISMDIQHQRTDEAEMSITRLGLEFKGDEIPDSEIAFLRKVWAENPKDLDSPMHYMIEKVEKQADDDPSTGGLRPADRRVLNVLRTVPEWLTTGDIGNHLANDPAGIPLKHRTIQAALKTLSEARLVDTEDALPGFAPRYRAASEEPPW